MVATLATLAFVNVLPEVVLATLPNIPIASINLDVAGLEDTHAAVFESDMPYTHE